MSEPANQLEMPAANPPADAAARPQVEARRPLARQIAEQLGETELGPLNQISRMLGLWGLERVQALAEEALALHAGEGMPTLKGDRKRSAGGIFFYLARGRASAEEWLRIQPYRPPRPRAQTPTQREPRAQPAPHPRPKPVPQPSAPSAPPASPAPAAPLTLAAVLALAETLKEGIAMTTTLKLIARPAEIKTMGKCICFALKSEKVPALPGGMPPLAAGTKYLVMVSAKQWNKIAPDLEADPEARVLIEGYPTHEQQFIAVEAMTCKLLPSKAEQQAKPPSAAGDAE